MTSKELDRIDALVATDVMDWVESAKGLPGWRDVTTGELVQGLRDWQPTRHIAPAWQVLEAMIVKGWLPSMVCIGRRGIWEVRFDKGGSSYVQQDKSASVTICLAALGALNVEVSHDLE
jgi:hypothetical protein